MASTTRFVAEIRTDSIMIYVFRSAGICGPAQSTARPATLVEADEILAGWGFRRSQDWIMGETYEGLMISADVRPVS